MDNTDVVKLQFKNSVTGEKKLQRYEQQLKTLKTALDNLPPGISITADDVKNAKKLAENLNESNEEGEKTEKIFSAAKFIAIAKGIGEMVQKVSKFTSISADYVENLNLMNVAYHRTEESMEEANLAGEKLVNTLSEMYGLDESNLTRTVGIFKQLANAMNLNDEIGNRLTKTLTQMSIDVSSLYNVSLERASSVLQSSLAGQTKPIRGLAGADITESTLQVTLNTYGIDRTVRDLSYVEKRLIIVTSLIDQLKESQNDYGKTIDSVSNQMRMFNEQTQRLTRAIGNVFIPILKAVLPYINGIMMVLTEIINMIAQLLGFDEGDLAGFAENTDVMEDFSDSMGEADKNAKKLKQSLRGFDKLNVINTPTSADGAGGSGVGGIDEGILDLFNQKSKEYEETLENITTKASKVRDTIMEWLGFTKQIDTETGKVSFKFDHITGGTVLGGLVVGGVIFSGVKKIFGFFQSIGSLLAPGKGSVAVGTSKWAGYFKNGSVILTGLLVIWECWSGIYEDIKSINENSEKFIEQTMEYKKQLSDTQKIEEALNDLGVNRTQAMINLNQNAKKGLEQSRKQISSSETLLDRIVDIVNSEELEFEKKQQILIQLKEQYQWNEKIIGKLEDQGKDTSELVDINNKYKDALKLVAEEIDGSEDAWKRVLKQAGLAKKDVEEIETHIKNTSLPPTLIDDLDKFGIKLDKSIIGPLDELSTMEFVAKVRMDLGTEKFKESAVKLLEKLKTTGFSMFAPNIDSVIKKIQRLKTGMDFVPHDYYGPVYLDYGERVLTKEENRAYMKGDSINNTTTYQGTTVSPTIVIKVGDEEIARKVLNNLQDMATANGQVIEIGG